MYSEYYFPSSHIRIPKGSMISSLFDKTRTRTCMSHAIHRVRRSTILIKPIFDRCLAVGVLHLYQRQQRVQQSSWHGRTRTGMSHALHRGSTGQEERFYRDWLTCRMGHTCPGSSMSGREVLSKRGLVIDPLGMWMWLEGKWYMFTT
jgi:hypothetical protein